METEADAKPATVANDSCNIASTALVVDTGDEWQEGGVMGADADNAIVGGGVCTKRTLFSGHHKSRPFTVVRQFVN